MTHGKRTAGRYDRDTESKGSLILVADDDADARRVACAFLKAEGYQYDAVASGHEALARLAQGDVDLLLLDVLMPEMDGFEVCQKLRADAKFERLPIVLVTANDAATEMMVRGLEAGADEYIQKPIRHRLLAARVKNLLRLASADRQRQLYAQLANAEKLAALGQVAAGVAHEINNPLSFILSNLSTLGQTMADVRTTLDAYRRSTEEGRQAENRLGLSSTLGDIEDIMKEILDGATRVRWIVQELRSLSRADEGPRERVDLKDVVSGALLLTEREIQARASVEKTLQPAPIPRARPGRLHQVVLNLLTNAVYALEGKARQDCRIRVTTRTFEGMAQLEVSDSGCGIPPEVQDRIFEPFFTTKPVGIGTGIGLSVCASVAHELGGRIEVRSKLGQGTTFLLSVPVEQVPTGAAT